MKAKENAENVNGREVLRKLLTRIARYRFLLVLSVVLAAATVVLQLYVPVLFGDAIDNIVAAHKVDFAAMWGYLRAIIACAAVSGVTAASNARRVSSGSKSRLPAMQSSAPCAASGRQTELCSKPEITTRAPGCTSVCTAIFSACVAFIVNTTCSASAPNSSAASVRQRNTASAAPIAAGYPPRPELEYCRIARSTASGTVSGFCKVVAAASK